MNLEGIVFGKGFLGTRIAEALNYDFAPRFNNHDLSAYLDYKHPDVVVNAIGKTGRPNTGWCETYKEETLEANVLIALSLGIECSKRNIYFVHLGSGCIYKNLFNTDGYDEEDEPNFYGPQFYAKTKIDAERNLKNLSNPCLQLRIRMPIDDRPHERNLIDKLKKCKRLINVQNSMTTVPHMLDAMKIFIEKRKTGVYNMVNPGTISAAEIMVMYRLLVDPYHTFESMSLEELDKEAGKRSNCTLLTYKLEREGIQLPLIHDAVRECLTAYKKYIK